MRRVVITGAGAVTPFGGLPATVAAVSDGRSAPGPIRAFDGLALGAANAGQILDVDFRAHFRQPKAMKITDRRTQFAVAAAAMACADAELTGEMGEALGVAVGTSGSDVQTEDLGRAMGPPSGGDVQDMEFFSGRILRRLHPLWLLVNLPNMASAHVAIQNEARGPNTTITTDWIAGLQAIGEAFRWVAGGECDAVLAGGADTAILPFAVAALEQSGLLAEGFQGGEGAAMFVLEERDHALGRGVEILAEVRGYSSGASRPGWEAEGLAGTMKRTLAEAGWNPQDVAWLGDAAIGARRFERFEETAVNEVFQKSPPQRLRVSSAMGFALAAAAPITLAVTTSDRSRGNLLINAAGFSGQTCSLAVECVGR